MIFIVIIFDILLLILWYRHKKKKGQKIPWYFGWIFPSDIISLSIVLLGVLASILIATDIIPLKEKRTKKEMTEIKKSIIKYNMDTGSDPTSITELIGSNPLRKKWKLDSWENEYKLIFKDGQIIKIISAGSDNQFNTIDDIEKIINN